MKILMVSIFSNHFFNWTEQLKDSGHEVYWLDVLDSNTRVERINFVKQIIGWRYKFNYPGRYFIKKKFPALNKEVNKINEQKLEKVFEQYLKEIQPDVVHSFVMYLATAPILKVMKKYPGIKWVYSSWGSDLYYYQNIKKELEDMKDTFPYIDYMFSDCNRDMEIARKLGFKGNFLGVFPGGGGFDFAYLNNFYRKHEDRNLILIKGYQGIHGKCIEILKSIISIKKELEDYLIVVFGADEEVKNFVKEYNIENWTNFNCYKKLPHSKVLELMGKSLLYIGNSTSDGTPNTLLEAIVLGAFPIQSNPGGATSETIKHQLNGLIIENPGDTSEISTSILWALNNKENLRCGTAYNLHNIKPKLERKFIEVQVLEKYKFIEDNLKL